jgi:hypothetical protein
LADGPKDLTTTTLATAAVDPQAIATAVPHSIAFRIIPLLASYSQKIEFPHRPIAGQRPSRSSLWFADELCFELNVVNKM